jgi:acyl-[acyl-carrier-protein]-phospholipid O-acyltransferase/long-chain-fatty-acid--[acyl-carrier-protein] ligase
LLEALPRLDLPNLWIPKRNQFFRVDAIPLLGTGKLNLHQLNQMASELARQAQPGGE